MTGLKGLKTLSGSRRRSYPARVVVPLVALALIVSLSGCFTPYRVRYALVISSSEGGSVTSPGEGSFAYWEGAVVNLTAEPEEGYLFVNWTGDVETIADIESAATTITVNGTCSISANFGLSNITQIMGSCCYIVGMRPTCSTSA
jgi:hypothetical protein